MTDIVEVGIHVSRHQLLVVVHVVHRITVFLRIKLRIGPCPQIGGSLFQIGLAEHGHRTVQQRQHGRRVLQLTLTLRCTIPRLCGTHIGLRQVYETVIGLTVVLLGIEDIRLQLAIGGYGIYLPGFLCLTQRLVQRPTLIRFVCLID